MKITLLFIVSFLLLQFYQCDRTLTVSADDLQIDTIKMYKIVQHKIVNGKLSIWRDTSKAIMAGLVKYIVPNRTEVKKGDTVLLLYSNNQISKPRHSWIDHSAVQSLNKKVDLLNTTLKHLEKLKHNNIKKLSESDLEQVYFSLDHSEMHLAGLSEDVNFDEIIKLLRIKIKKLKVETSNLESKLNDDEDNIDPLALMSKFDGKLNFLVSDDEFVKPMQSLFYIESGKGGKLVIKLDQIPNDEFQFTARIKLDNEILNLQLDGLEEQNGILRVTSEILDQLNNVHHSFKLIFESKPTKKLLIKRSALHKKGRGYYVFTKRNNRFEAVRVKIGNLSGSTIEILDGLQPNDQIIVSSSQPIWQMSQIEIKN